MKIIVLLLSKNNYQFSLEDQSYIYHKIDKKTKVIFFVKTFFFSF